MNEEKISSTGFKSPEPPASASPPSGSGLQQVAKETAQSAKTQIETLKSAARKQGDAAVEEIKTVAKSAARQAQDVGSDFIHEQKESLARKIDQYSRAVRVASERLGSEEGNVLAGPAEKAAVQLERMSSYLREKQPADVLDDLESLARRRPEVVFGGLFVVGFAAARFFKASRKSPRDIGSPDDVETLPYLSSAAPVSTPSAALSSPSAAPSASLPPESSSMP